MAKERFSEVKLVDRREIMTRPTMFQGREEPYSEATVDKILKEGFDKSNAPIVVWYDDKVDKFIILSGHSRWEASKRLYERGQENLAVMPVKVFNGTMEEAVDYAVLESNRESTQESLKSDLKAFKKQLARGCNSDCLKAYFRDDAKISKYKDLANLNLDGLFISQLNKGQAANYQNLELFARWTGKIRKDYPEITDQQENEIFEYLYSGKLASIPTKETFYKLIQKAVNNVDFSPNNPLNLKNFESKSIFKVNADNQVLEIEQQIKEYQKRNNYLDSLIKRADASGKNRGQKYDDWNFEFNENNKNIRAKKIQIDKINGSVVSAERLEVGLFAGMDMGDDKDDIIVEKEVIQPPKETPIFQQKEPETETKTSKPELEKKPKKPTETTQKDVSDMSFDEFVTYHKKYKGKDFSILNVKVEYLPTSDKYKMEYPTTEGFQTYKGDMYEVLVKAYANVMDRAKKTAGNTTTTLPAQDKPTQSPIKDAYEAKIALLNETQRNNLAEIKIGDYVLLPPKTDTKGKILEGKLSGFVTKITPKKIELETAYGGFGGADVILQNLSFLKSEWRTRGGNYLQPQKQEPTPKPIIKEVREAKPPAPAGKEKEAWEMTLQEYNKSPEKNQVWELAGNMSDAEWLAESEENYKEIIDSAIYKGYSVPEKVLSQYPEFITRKKNKELSDYYLKEKKDFDNQRKATLRATRLSTLPNATQYINLKTDKDMSLQLLKKIEKADTKTLPTPLKKEVELFKDDLKTYREADMSEAEIAELETTQIPDGTTAPFNSLAYLSDAIEGKLEKEKEGAGKSQGVDDEKAFLAKKLKAVDFLLEDAEGEEKAFLQKKKRAIQMLLED